MAKKSSTDAFGWNPEMDTQPPPNQFSTIDRGQLALAAVSNGNVEQLMALQEKGLTERDLHNVFQAIHKTMVSNFNPVMIEALTKLDFKWDVVCAWDMLGNAVAVGEDIEQERVADWILNIPPQNQLNLNKHENSFDRFQKLLFRAVSRLEFQNNHDRAVKLIEQLFSSFPEHTQTLWAGNDAAVNNQAALLWWMDGLNTNRPNVTDGPASGNFSYWLTTFLCSSHPNLHQLKSLHQWVQSSLENAQKFSDAFPLETKWSRVVNDSCLDFSALKGQDWAVGPMKFYSVMECLAFAGNTSALSKILEEESSIAGVERLLTRPKSTLLLASACNKDMFFSLLKNHATSIRAFRDDLGHTFGHYWLSTRVAECLNKTLLTKLVSSNPDWFGPKAASWSPLIDEHAKQEELGAYLTKKLIVRATRSDFKKSNSIKVLRKM